MNQTQKRLNIIKLAISITDLETIQLQILKLTPMKSDSKIQEILTLLQSESYGQAQALITDYIETAPEEIHQRSAKTPATHEISEEDQAIIDEFQLFVTPKDKETAEILEIDINDYASKEPKITKNQGSVDYDALLNLDANDVLSDNIDIDISHSDKKEKVEDVFFNPPAEESVDFLFDDHVPKDTFFDVDQKEESTPKSGQKDHLDELLSVEKTQVLQGTTKIHKIQRKTEETILEEKDIFNTPIVEEQESTLSYKAMPHISQKLISMKKQYPPIQKTYERFDTVEALLTKIAQDGYTETEMEEMIEYVGKLIENAKYTEASQLLLVCGATESKFAQFMLARELFKGSVLTKNIQESFTLMNTLATDDYPEALCDLGQFYENGIGTSQDLMKAEGLYKESLNLGIKRAKKHYSRLKKLNRGVFKS
ncbi:MAG: sel1 repeat family protein [Epsilonproteobacteria bacterium]|nr:sel1 repeat family protein [Campylobacterota bacterium]